MWVHKFGTHFTSSHHVCGEYGHLDGYICTFVRHPGTCVVHARLSAFNPDTNTVDACPSVDEFGLSGVRYPPCLALLQHAPSQLEC